MSRIRASKENPCKCPLLFASRAYYFEPNPATAEEWRASGAYLSGIDPRVVFVCQGPGRQFASKNTWPPLRCWANTPQDDRFRQARREHGFVDCYITNVVKCGVRERGRHTEHELSACRVFLVRELDLLEPLVAVGVGENAYRTLRQDALPLVRTPPVCFQITHFAARGDVRAKWEREFAELKRLLGRLRPRPAW